MKRILISVLSAGIVLGSLGGAAAAKKPARVERTVTGAYGAFPAPVTGCNEPLGTYACLIVETRATEKFFTAKVTDTHGLPVYFEVPVDGRYFGFCGKTTQPIQIRPGATLEFDIGLPRWGVQTQCPASSIKTVGTISVTLSNTP